MIKRDELAAVLRGEGCLGRSADDEPVFILVARDQLAANVVRTWAAAAQVAGVNDAKVAEARALADKMDTWREAHDGGKVPD